MFVTLRKKIGGSGLKEITVSFMKISLASLAMGFIALSSYNFFGQTLRQNLALVLSIGIAALAYAILIYFMRIPEVDQMIGAVKKRLGQRGAEERKGGE